MLHRIGYCIHCGVQYTYLASGDDGEDHTYDHSEYCQECYEVIVKALAKIPIKVGKKFVPSTDFTKEEFLKELKKRRKGRFVRIWPGLFKLENNKIKDSQETVGLPFRDPKTGRRHLYRLTYWDHDPEWTLEKEYFWDLKEDKPLECYSPIVTEVEILKEGALPTFTD